MEQNSGNIKRETFYRLSAVNKLLEWTIEMNVENNVYTISTSHGQVNGKKTKDKGIIVSSGKAGRSTLEQANLQYNSLINKKLDTGYTNKQDGVNNQDSILPMLAQNFEVHNKKIIFPALAQPKLDGIRCTVRIIGGHAQLYSRKGKMFMTLDHISMSIKMIDLPENIIFDGELFSDTLDFQRVTGLVRKKKLNDTDIADMNLLKLNIFDCVCLDNMDCPFYKRWEIAADLIKKDRLDNLKIVPIYQVENMKNIEELLYKFLEDDHEGVMIRNVNSLYEIDKRSYNLQKYKKFTDSEYIIVGAYEGQGNDAGTVIWICSTKDGTEFSVRPKGTRIERREWFENKELFYGKLLTVKYQELTNDGIPRFPVGVAIRDYE